MKIFAYIAFAILILYAALLAFAFFFADMLIFPRSPKSYTEEEGDVFLKLPDGAKILGRFFPAPKSEICVIYSHGNGEDIGMISDTVKLYVDAGFSVFAYDYPGYGLSDPGPSVPRLRESAEAAWRHVSGLGFKPGNIAAVGYSLGSVAACEIIGRHPDARCAVLIGGIANGPKVVLPFNVIPWDILDNSKILSSSKPPVLIVHGDSDIVVPPRNARENYKICSSAKRLVWIKGMGHYGLEETEIYKNSIFKFIRNPK